MEEVTLELDQTSKPEEISSFWKVGGGTLWLHNIVEFLFDYIKSAGTMRTKPLSEFLSKGEISISFLGLRLETYAEQGQGTRFNGLKSSMGYL